MNQCTFVGRLVSDPEMRTSASGVEFCKFKIAVDRRYKNKDGEHEADFIPCSVWRQTAAFVNNYWKKGDPILVCGSLETRSYTDKDGNNRTAYEIAVNNVEFLPQKKSTGNSETFSQFHEMAESDDKPLPF